YAQKTFGTNELGMSIYTEYDLSQPLQPRSSALETLDAIIQWATRADELFAEAGVGFKADNTSQFNRGLTNYVIAQAALLAVEANGANKEKYFAIALDAADRVINEGGLSFMVESQYVQSQSGTTNIDGTEYPVFRAETTGFLNFAQNPEAAVGFGWQFSGNGIASYSNIWRGSFRIDDRLYNKIDSRDYRRKNFHAERPADFPTVYYPGPGSFIDGGQSEVPTFWVSKFANNVGLGGTVGNANTTVRGRADYAMIRLSEFYLLKAEVQARTGDEENAKRTLDILLAARTEEGAVPLTCDTYASMSG